MAEKRRKRESTDNKKKKQSSKNSKSNKSSNKNSCENKKLSDFSYAELIVLSATLSYSLAQELDEDDLDIFLVFLGLLITDMQLIVTQRAIRARSQPPLDEEELDVTEEDIDIDLGE